MPRSLVSLAVPIAIGLLPALALACLLVSNWAAGGVPAETLQLDASIPVLVNMEPGQSLRVFGELQAHRSREKSGWGRSGCRDIRGACSGPDTAAPTAWTISASASRGLIQTTWRARSSGNTGDALCMHAFGARVISLHFERMRAHDSLHECRRVCTQGSAARFDSWFAHSRNVACRRPDWEQKYGLCWAGARDNFEHCYASASASASFQKEQQMHCKDLFLNHVQSCA